MSSSKSNENNNNTENKITNNQVNTNPTEKKKLDSKLNILEKSKNLLISTDELNKPKNLIILGQRHSGKTIIFNSLTSETNNLNFQYIPTSGINYGFMRYQHTSSKKKVLNVFEIGGGVENISLLRTIVNNKSIQNTIIFVVCDFAKPNLVLKGLFSFIKEIRKIFEELIDKSILKEILNNKESLLPKNVDKNNLNILPFHLYVIGNKYDLLEKYEPEKVRWASLSLRYFTTYYGFNLIFHSSKEEKLINILKSTVTNYAFGQSAIDNINKYIQKNETRAIYIKYYNDTLDELGDPKVMQRQGADNRTLWIETYDTLFKNSTNKEEDDDDNKDKDIDVNKDFWELFKENKIDSEMKMFEKAKEKESLRNDRNNDTLNQSRRLKSRDKTNK